MTEEFDNEMDNEFESSPPELEPVPIEDYSDSFGQDDITEDDKLWAFLAYVLTPVLPIIILLLDDKKDRPFIKAHNGQALAWGVVNIVGGTVLSVIFFLCPGLPSLVIWGIGVYWGWQAFQGKYVTIPVITDFVRNQGWA